jgi:hypothetical protein
MPRESSRMPRPPIRIIADRIQHDTLSEAARRFPAVRGRYTGGTSGEVVEVTEPYEDEDGVISTAHPAFYDIDAYDDPTAKYFEG